MRNSSCPAELTCVAIFLRVRLLLVQVIKPTEQHVCRLLQRRRWVSADAAPTRDPAGQGAYQMQKCLGLEHSKLVMLSLDSEKICIASPARAGQKFVLICGDGISHAVEVSVSRSALNKICDNATACITDIMGHAKYA